MKAVAIRRYGGPEVLKVEDLPPPSPAAGEVLVRVHASSINPIDWKIRQGQLKWIQGWKFPRILGFDLCGEVVSVGSPAGNLQPGQIVYARSDRATGEAHAELVAAREASVALKPASLSVEEAGTLPLAGLTALQALRDLGGLRAGQRALILGASGGVGMFGVQIARALGAEAVGVCGPDTLEFVRQLGAAEVLDYRRQTLTSLPGPFSVIFDAVGLYGFWKTRELLASPGVYVSTLPMAGVLLMQLGGNLLSTRKARLILVKPRGHDLDFLSRLADAGKLKTSIDSEFRLDEIQEAHRRSESGRVRGKILVRVR